VRVNLSDVRQKMATAMANRLEQRIRKGWLHSELLGLAEEMLADALDVAQKHHVFLSEEPR
jgi:hypothetical protein